MLSVNINFFQKKIYYLFKDENTLFHFQIQVYVLLNKFFVQIVHTKHKFEKFLGNVIMSQFNVKINFLCFLENQICKET